MAPGIHEVESQGFGYFLAPGIHEVESQGFGYFLDPRIYVVTGVICTSMRSCLLASLVDNNKVEFETKNGVLEQCEK